MGLFGLGKKSDDDIAERPAMSQDECVHGVRLAHWDSVDAMGHYDQVEYYTCESCGKRLTPEEDAEIKAAAPVESAGS